MVTKAKQARPAARAARATRKPRPSGAAKRPAAKRPALKRPAAKRPAAKRPAAKKAAAKGTKKNVAAKAAKQPAAKPKLSERRAGQQPPTMPDLGGPTAVRGLSEEDQIREAKYLPRELPERLFEEERFVFPETYGVNRIRLLVRDPEWIFTYWDVSPEALKELARSLGERSFALARLTLRIVDAVSGAVSDILLPSGARWWYVRTDAARRKYRAELGVALPSGEFRRLAWSNSVVTPRVGPSPGAAESRVSYGEAEKLPIALAADAAAEDGPNGLTLTPWAGSLAGAAEPAEPATAGRKGRKGGAKDAFGSGANRPGASDGFRR
jgi:hypothetical protein